ncbi:uncharacterized protein LOC141613265 [Silene latifolia]|uniref:uncharacterized protein LOC141613265 n=1 Tax=Silene latifolia TaxID=37657 RepID=UPI003D7783AE
MAINPTNLMDRYPNRLNERPPLSLMTWNVQGAGSTAFLTMLKQIIRVNKPQVLALVETHISGETAQRVCDRINYGGKTRVEAEEFSGGIWLFWKPEEVSVTPIIHHSQHITVEIARVGEIPWYFSAVYASPDWVKKEELWRSLEEFTGSRNRPWLTMGDFNDTRFVHERNGNNDCMRRRCAKFNSWLETNEFAGSHNRPWLTMGDFNDTRFVHERNGNNDCMRRRCAKFNSWLETNEWIDLNFTGPEYTWSRGNTVATRKWAQLDRAICNSSWRVMFADGSLRHLVQNQSDHCPILVNTNGFAPIPAILKPFRFHAVWMCHDKFSEFIKHNWRNDQPLIPFIYNFAEALQDWNKNVFGNIFARKQSLERRLLGVQKRLSREGPNYFLKYEMKLKQQLDDTLRQEELLWF